MKSKFFWGLVYAVLFISHIFCFGLGVFCMQEHYKLLPAKVIHTEIIRELPKYTTITLVDRQVEVEKVIVYPRYFSSLEELKAWLSSDDTNSTVFSDHKGSTSNQCEDYAMQLMERALRAGYIVSTETLYSAEYYQLYFTSMPESACHMVNLVIIGNDAYIVDPGTDKIFYWHPLD